MISSPEGVSKIVASVVVVVVAILVIILASVLVTNARNSMNAMKRQVDAARGLNQTDAGVQSAVALLRAQYSQLMSWMWIWAVVLALGIVWMIMGVAGIIKSSSMNANYEAIKEAMMRRIAGAVGMSGQEQKTAAAASAAAKAASLFMEDMF